MDRKRRLAHWWPAVGMVAAALCLTAVGLRGQEDSTRAAAMALAWKMIADPARAREDVSALAARTVVLSPEQAVRVRRLGLDYALEKARVLRELQRTTTDKVREVLNETQRARYDEVLVSLEELSDAEAAARDGFAKALGLSPQEAAGVPITGAFTDDLTGFLGIDEQTNRRVAELKAEVNAAQQKALLEGLDPSRWDDVEEWRRHREQYEQAAQEAREQYERRLAELLSPQQVERMQELEAADQQYRQAIRKARRRAYERLYAALRPAVPDE